MRNKIFHNLLQRLIKNGTLHVIDHSGRKHTYSGSISVSENTMPEITMRLHNQDIVGRLLINPDLAMGEGYMNGEVTIEGGSIYDLLFLLASNLDNTFFSLGHKIHAGLPYLINTFIKRINPRAAKANVAHHYDLPPRLYELFLDEDRQYSCAYFRTLENDLNMAQLDKKHHLAAKLRLQPDLKVLDIGCGWGGLALYLAKHHGVHVTGLTLSEEQCKIARQRAIDAGLSDQVQFIIQDYREITSTFDRIVSVGMFEHVGVAHYKEFFQQVYALLASDGVALLHSIGVEYDPGFVSSWINKYIFPGGQIPSLSQVVPVIEKQRFHITDIEFLHHHYANTLHAWRDRFLANVEHLPDHLDDRFVRMWEYYLAGSQVSFEKLGLMNFQIQLMKDKSLIPLTRDYIYEAEHALHVSHSIHEQAS